jgi:hypothetical protein
LRNNGLDTFAPEARTTNGVASVFADDYQARGVTSLGIDLQTFALDFSTTCQRPLSLILDTTFGYYGLHAGRFAALDLPIAGDDPSDTIEGSASRSRDRHDAARLAMPTNTTLL